MFDLEDLAAAIARHGRVARVVITGFDGSSPREAGAAMLIWAEGQSGTIGGGALEWEATQNARALLAQGGQRLDRVPLGPRLGQCCGGAVSLLTEVFGPDDALPTPEHGLILRSIDGRPMPLSVRRVLDRARAQGLVARRPQMVQGWFIEPLAQPTRQVWVWGAGHVGRALVQVLAPLPDVAVTWVDIAEDRFPAELPAGVTLRVASDPARLVDEAPAQAEHLIVTYSHALDLDLCHRLLGHGFRRCGLIGSQTKWARFRSRLNALGHSVQGIGRIDCPIGDPSLGKHPQAIAIGVATAFLRQRTGEALRQETAG